MSITAIATSIAAVSGNAALPGAGDIQSENALLPFAFAALLAEQIPLVKVAGGAAQIASSVQAGQQDTTLPGDTTTKEQQLPIDSLANGTSTADILAALTSSPKKTAEAGSGKDHNDKEQIASSDTGIIPTAAPVVAQTLGNSLPQTDASLSMQAAKTSASVIPAKDGRPALPEEAHPLSLNSAPAQQAGRASPTAAARQDTPLAESYPTPRTDTANAAILAGDANTGNSGNTTTFASALAATGTPVNATAGSAQQTPFSTVTTALDAPNWQHDFGTHVVWLAKNDQQVAHININPPQLGPVQISISLNGDQASATFASPHPEVRQAIQDALPQLRDMFTTAGISLGQANVGSQLPSQNREASYQFANEARSSRENAILSPDSHASSASAGIPIQRGRGLVDLFA